MNFLINAGYALLGAVLSWLISYLWEILRFKKEYKSNNEINLSGDDWCAAWQTSVDGEAVLNTEEIRMRQKGGTVKISNKQRARENPKAGYLWEGQLQFYQGRDLMGWYFSKQSEQNTNKGILYFNYDSAKKLFIGMWVGSSYDGPLLSGFGVIAKNRQQALDTLKGLCDKHRNKITIIAQRI